MKRFASLIRSLGETRDPSARAGFLDAYLRSSSEEEATWAVALLLGLLPPKVMTPAECRSWFLEASGLPQWLAEVCHVATGDASETAALGLPYPVVSSGIALPAFVDFLSSLARSGASARKEAVMNLWQQLDPDVRLVCNALFLGLPPLVLSAGEIARAVAGAVGGSAPLLEHRLQQDWDPAAAPIAALAASTAAAADPSRPYPFAAREPLVSDFEDLGDVNEWLVGWRQDGIRAQLVFRGGEAFLWADSGELINAGFPGIISGAAALPEGTVVEGVISGVEEKGAAARGKRRSSRRASAGAPREASLLFGTDLHELAGRALQQTACGERQERLRELIEALPAGSPLRMSAFLPCSSWDEARTYWTEARRRGAAGLSLRRRSSAMHDQDAFLVWPVDPLLVTTVLLYAEQGVRTGRGYARFTVAVWDAGRLVPIAAVPPDLPPEEAAEVSSYIAAHTADRFGPVRTVRPGLVFEVAFDGLEPSGRRKSGVQLRGPRLMRWRRDVPPESASTLEYLRSLLSPH